MIDDSLRFTGENPPPSIWFQLPNWENAFNEETVEGQDETTLRPSGNQKTIDETVSFTAGDALFQDGKLVPALLGLIELELDWIYIYPNPLEDKCFVLRFDHQEKRWAPMNDDWFINGPGLLLTPVHDSNIWPMRVESRLPYDRSGSRISLSIEISND